jgi:hypothetical protein
LREADTGNVTLWAPAATARSNPFTFGASATTLSPGSVSAVRNDFARVRHRGNQLGRNERSDFDFLDACGRERADPALLRLGRHQVLGVLQPVARADFADMDVAHEEDRPG